MVPFSITAGAIGITNVATTSIVQLRSLVDNLSEAQEVVADIISSLDNIERPLAALEKLSIPNEATSIAVKEDLYKAGVAEAVNSCGYACKKFREDLTKWTKHSNATKLSLRDRFSVGVWNKEKIRTFRTQLQWCENTVHFAVTSTQLMIQLRSEKTSEADRESLRNQLQTFETKIMGHIDLTKHQQDEAQTRKRELEEEPEDEEYGGAIRLLAIQEVEKQSCLLETDQVSCGVVFSQVQSKRSGQEIRNVITSANSNAHVGMPASVVGKINQRISNIRTDRGSTAYVGVF
ncbi:hypothetical protein COCC4DRAFT_195238 [Bipolaris maydis ATCC 48331]|uniref:Azaphilone pigments biosynthesis cluster protein L N-terminal domain-containing protein n=2 Tax=Cochliobolus heterostrophus TaxID=5016 RepID=M2U557_COCH5|nr:uncharacterized protein COCC4DRAFT_195238 [Bipolaris maydis ATCC 48331]EMD88831.1 hypothetical protein COCHEDRAFT_1182229 [Bipolaris maydis C5]KAH7556528.1 hypothetical protein BM1_05962 [Bipolaris maydis]ENI05453.1 hypothetical protein COCC4DRAFT_195238 [Bipolaris maydis ATCC 48331]KAJ5028597.1 hypothetical protein J3E73DRAFT_407548 [Bipolaris maydis]KAJ5063378.1 hypothetical protein J3E74DRAFT_415987 [Bipolaris maydis]